MRNDRVALQNLAGKVLALPGVFALAVFQRIHRTRFDPTAGQGDGQRRGVPGGYANGLFKGGNVSVGRRDEPKPQSGRHAL